MSSESWPDEHAFQYGIELRWLVAPLKVEQIERFVLTINQFLAGTIVHKNIVRNCWRVGEQCRIDFINIPLGSLVQYEYRLAVLIRRENIVILESNAATSMV